MTCRFYNLNFVKKKEERNTILITQWIDCLKNSKALPHALLNLKSRTTFWPAAKLKGHISRTITSTQTPIFIQNQTTFLPRWLFGSKKKSSRKARKNDFDRVRTFYFENANCKRLKFANWASSGNKFWRISQRNWRCLCGCVFVSFKTKLAKHMTTVFSRSREFPLII